MNCEELINIFIFRSFNRSENKCKTSDSKYCFEFGKMFVHLKICRLSSHYIALIPWSVAYKITERLPISSPSIGGYLVFSCAEWNFQFEDFSRKRLELVLSDLMRKGLCKNSETKSSFHRDQEPADIFILQRGDAEL